MIRLRNAHRGERALVVFGGPSLLATGFDFGWLRRSGFVTFLETKALTPRFVEAAGSPDYYLMLFPEKTKDNAIQHFVYRSLLADYRIDPLLKPEYRQTAADIREHFNDNFESWRPERGPHKRYRWRPDVYLRDSPYDLLARVPAARLIVNRPLLDHYFPGCPYRDRAFYFEQSENEREFDVEKYFNPVERDGTLVVRGASTFLNSAAIALYPLLNYLGFRETYFIGMDMSILGSLEYAAPYTFRSMAHFWWFWMRNGRVFNGNFKRNGLMFARPQSEFDDLRMLWNASPVAFTRVYEPWRYATPVNDIRTTSFEQAFGAGRLSRSAGGQATIAG